MMYVQIMAKVDYESNILMISCNEISGHIEACTNIFVHILREKDAETER